MSTLAYDAAWGVGVSGGYFDDQPSDTTERDPCLPTTTPIGEWWFFGACRTVVPRGDDARVDVFIRRHGDSYGSTDLRTCSECPVAADCRAFALSDPILIGTWGGTTERQRVAWRRLHGTPGPPALLDTSRKGSLQVRLITLRATPNRWHEVITFVDEQGASAAVNLLSRKVRMVSPGHLEFSAEHLADGGSLLRGRYVPDNATMALRAA